MNAVQQIDNPLSPQTRREFVKGLLTQWVREANTSGVVTTQHPMEAIRQMQMAANTERSSVPQSKPPAGVMGLSHESRDLLVHLAVVNRVDPGYYRALVAWAQWRAAAHNPPWEVLKTSRTVFDKRFEGGVAILMSRYY